MMGQLSSGQERLLYSFNLKAHIPQNRPRADGGDRQKSAKSGRLKRLDFEGTVSYEAGAIRSVSLHI